MARAEEPCSGSIASISHEGSESKSWTTSLQESRPQRSARGCPRLIASRVSPTGPAAAPRTTVAPGGGGEGWRGGELARACCCSVVGERGLWEATVRAGFSTLYCPASAPCELRDPTIGVYGFARAAVGRRRVAASVCGCRVPCPVLSVHSSCGLCPRAIDCFHFRGGMRMARSRWNLEVCQTLERRQRSARCGKSTILLVRTATSKQVTSNPMRG